MQKSDLTLGSPLFLSAKKEGEGWERAGNTSFRVVRNRFYECKVPAYQELSKGWVFLQWKSHLVEEKVETWIPRGNEQASAFPGEGYRENLLAVWKLQPAALKSYTWGWGDWRNQTLMRDFCFLQSKWCDPSVLRLMLWPLSNWRGRLFVSWGYSSVVSKALIVGKILSPTELKFAPCNFYPLVLVCDLLRNSNCIYSHMGTPLNTWSYCGPSYVLFLPFQIHKSFLASRWT